MNIQQQVFSFQQVATACRKLIDEEAHLIVDNVLARRSGVVSDLFSRMLFDGFEYIDRNLISTEQASLVEHYGV
jgi:hypothetical protein